MVHKEGMSDGIKGPHMFTIGALSRASGVPADTLRTWERRYGFPKPERTDSGHRRYSPATLERLQLVREALKLGHRAATILQAEVSSLRDLVERSQRAEPDEPLANPRLIDRWIELVRRFDGRGLERELRASLATLGAPAFLAWRMSPFLHALGERWADGLLGARHEHFASERVAEFFLRQWRPLSDACLGPAVVCATPAGERHALGLQMAALTLALNNLRVVYLGPDLPAQEIADAVTQHGASALVLSAAQGTSAVRLEQECAELRRALGDGFPIVAGGVGFSGAQQVTVFHDFEDLARWAERLADAVV